MRIEAVWSSETLVSAYKITLCHNIEDHYLNNYRRENLKTCICLPILSSLHHFVGYLPTLSVARIYGVEFVGW
jgi:hypothetical protein